ncbi:MAG: hypothetical protein ABW123_15370 [Cystobacter sp.]
MSGRSPYGSYPPPPPAYPSRSSHPSYSQQPAPRYLPSPPQHHPSSAAYPHLPSPPSAPPTWGPSPYPPSGAPAQYAYPDPYYEAIQNLPRPPSHSPTRQHDGYANDTDYLAQLNALGPPPSHSPRRSHAYPATPSYPSPSSHPPPSPPRRREHDNGYDDLTAGMASLSIPTAPPSSSRRSSSLSRADIADIVDNRLGIRSGSGHEDARNAAYSLSADIKPEQYLRGMSSSQQTQWMNDLRGSIRKMLDSPNADSRYLILASGVGSTSRSERYQTHGGLETFPKGQVMGESLASTSLAGKSEEELVAWVLRQIKT